MFFLCVPDVFLVFQKKVKKPTVIHPSKKDQVNEKTCDNSPLTNDPLPTSSLLLVTDSNRNFSPQTLDKHDAFHHRRLHLALHHLPLRTRRHGRGCRLRRLHDGHGHGRGGAEAEDGCLPRRDVHPPRVPRLRRLWLQLSVACRVAR